MDPTITVELTRADWLELKKALGNNVALREDESASAFGEPTTLFAVVAGSAAAGFAAWLAKSRSLRRERVTVTVQDANGNVKQVSYCSLSYNEDASQGNRAAAVARHLKDLLSGEVDQ